MKALVVLSAYVEAACVCDRPLYPPAPLQRDALPVVLLQQNSKPSLYRPCASEE